MSKSLPQQSTTTTTQALYTLCTCCVRHNNAVLVLPTVKCPECGESCNCEGCVVEARDSS